MRKAFGASHQIGELGAPVVGIDPGRDGREDLLMSDVHRDERNPGWDQQKPEHDFGDKSGGKIDIHANDNQITQQKAVQAEIMQITARTLVGHPSKPWQTNLQTSGIPQK